MVWVLKAHPSFEKDLKKLSKADRERLTKLIFKIKEDPARLKPLKGFHGVFRVRFSGFRLVYALKGEIIHSLYSSSNFSFERLCMDDKSQERNK